MIKFFLLTIFLLADVLIYLLGIPNKTGSNSSWVSKIFIFHPDFTQLTYRPVVTPVKFSIVFMCELLLLSRVAFPKSLVSLNLAAQVQPQVSYKCNVISCISVSSALLNFQKKKRKESSEKNNN